MTQPFEHARWIWLQNAKPKNSYVQFRKEFALGEEIRTARLCIRADSNYAVWINGRLVDFGQYADYPTYMVYDELDVAAYLRRGKNWICILAHYIGENSFVYIKGRAGLLYELQVNETAAVFSQPGDLCRIDEGYANGEIETITGQLGYAYRYSALHEDDWLSDGYRPASRWEEAVLVELPYELHGRPVRKLVIGKPAKAAILSQGIFRMDPTLAGETAAVKMQNAYLAFRERKAMTGGCTAQLPSEEGIEFASPGGDGIYLVLDLGREEAGVFTLSIQAEKETEIYVGYGEHLEDLRVRTSVGPRNFAVSVRCKPDKTEFTGYFRRFGCRYLQLFVHADRFRLHYAGIMPTDYPFEPAAFEVGDKLHQKIYDVSRRTLLLCAHEHYEDCPWREQALYSMDSRNQMLFGYYAFGGHEFARASLKLLALGVRSDALLSMCSPAVIFNTIPSFNLTYFLQVYEYMLFSGDLSLGQEVFEVCTAVMQVFLDRRDSVTGLIPNFPEREYWNFYEWSEGLMGDNNPAGMQERSFDAPLNAMLSMALQAFSAVCGLLNKPDAAARYIRHAQELNEAIDSLFWNEEEGAYWTFIKDGEKQHLSQLTQALVVCSGACRPARMDRVLEKLFDDRFVPITLSYSVFKYDALLKNRPGQYGKRVFDEVAQKWGDMLFNRATSFWETEKGEQDFDRAGSLCHGWSAVPIYLYYAYGVGIYPEEPGFKAYRLRPVDTGLTFHKAEIKLPEGGFDAVERGARK